LQLKSVLDKTGARRQADLVSQLSGIGAHRLSWMMKVPGTFGWPSRKPCFSKQSISVKVDALRLFTLHYFPEKIYRACSLTNLQKITN
jgi:hypothetical protein